MISHEGMLLIYIMFIYIFILLHYLYITYILAVWQACFWSWFLIVLLFLNVWQFFFLFLILLFTFGESTVKKKTLRALMMAPECLVWVIVLPSPSVVPIILGGGHELQNCAWCMVNTSLLHASGTLIESQGHYTSV